LRDAHQVPGALQRSQQGNFRLDPTRCAVYLANTKNFPKNTEVETTLTFTSEGEPGPWVRQVTPLPQAITVREHISFVELPPTGNLPTVSRLAWIGGIARTEIGAIGVSGATLRRSFLSIKLLNLSSGR
jgi:hypothetical protein